MWFTVSKGKRSTALTEVDNRWVQVGRLYRRIVFADALYHLVYQPLEGSLRPGGKQPLLPIILQTIVHGEGSVHLHLQGEIILL